MSRTRRAARRAARVLLAAGLLALWYAAYVVTDAKAYQAIEQRRFEQSRQGAAVAPALVESTAVVPPSDVEVLEPRGGRTLTLITCFPFSYLGSAPDRFIVRARETEGPQ